MNSDRRDGRPCKTMSDSVTSFLPSPTSFPSDSLPSLTTTPVLVNSIATDPSAFNSDNDQIEQGPPIAAVAGAGAAAVILIIAVAIWYIVRRRRRQQQQQQQSKSNAVSPSSSSYSKPRVQHNNNLDLEKQLDFTTLPSTTTHDDPSIVPTIPNDPNNKQQTSSPVLYSSSTSNNHNNSQEESTVRTKKKASQQSMRQQSRRSPSIQSQTSARTNVSGAIVINTEASTPPVPPRRESMHYQPEAALELQKQLATTSTAGPPSIPAPPPSGDVHIDMVSLDLEKLMPIVISEELQLPGEARPAAQSTPTTINIAPPVALPQIPIEPSTLVARPQPVHSTTEVTPSPIPRRPSMMSRKSTDSVRSRVGSTCHPPPPPPPSIPLPALPMAYPGGVDARGRRSTASSSNRGSTPSRRSISLESATRWARDLGSDSNNTSARNSHESFSKGCSTPSSPPSSVASSSPAFRQLARIPSRSRHQRCPSQILGTQFFASPEQVPTSPPPQHRRPISPPVAPLTVQIPRTSSRPIHTYFGGPQHQPTFTAPAQPESPTIGSFETSPVASPTSSIIAELPSIASRTSSLRPSYVGSTGGYPTPSQRSRSRSISQSSSEIDRVALPGATGAAAGTCSLPPVPLMPSLLGDHLPPPPPSHSFLLRRYPSLLQHRPSSGSLSSMDQDDNDDILDPSRKKRRSMSVDSAGRWISSQRGGGSSCSVSPVPGQDHHAEDSDPLARQDQEVQAIIADAIAIAQAKSAAVQAARQSTWYRQYQQQQMMMMQMQQQQQQQQIQQFQKTVAAGAGGDDIKGGPVNTSPWTSSESHFTEEKTTVSACTSRSSSPFYSSLD
ncbi:hypothetical protein BGZ92_010072 [Podila epicladia]|nr:hypothetical protein BGZ92_010072 [Podila epicladia]